MRTLRAAHRGHTRAEHSVGSKSARHRERAELDVEDVADEVERDLALVELAQVDAHGAHDHVADPARGPPARAARSPPGRTSAVPPAPWSSPGPNAAAC